MTRISHFERSMKTRIAIFGLGLAVGIAATYLFTGNIEIKDDRMLILCIKEVTMKQDSTDKSGYWGENHEEIDNC